MLRRQTSRQRPTSDDPDPEPASILTLSDEISEKIKSIEEDVQQRFEEIDEELNRLKNDSEKILKKESNEDERFLKLCHAVDYLLERTDNNYETIACREMVLTLLGQKTARPFSGRTIRNRQLCRRMKRWCLFTALILFLVASMSIYGLHQNWSYLLVGICLSGSFISCIGLRRIYKIIEIIW